MAVGETNAERRVRKYFSHSTVQLDRFFFSHRLLSMMANRDAGSGGQSGTSDGVGSNKKGTEAAARFLETRARGAR